MILDTIAAIATPLGQSGIGVVRVSGPEALEVLEKMFRTRRGQSIDVQDWSSHTARYGRVVEPATGETLDDAVVLVFRAPNSYTGENVIEISCHGGSFLLQRVLEATYRAGARGAEPGEFTKRAFLNGKLDLAQSEAVMDLIGAKTDESRRVALGQLHGRLSEAVQAVRHDLLGVIASIEAIVDFPEEDIEALDTDSISRALGEVTERLEELLSTARTGRILREGLRTAITGRPNVGKSSLLNAMLQEERAIVTAIPGTTRDVIEEQVSVGGVPIVISDTAGVREADDEVERLGVERTRKAVKMADLILLVLDDSQGLTVEDRRLYDEVTGRSAQVVVVVNKIDLDKDQISDAELRALGLQNIEEYVVRVSAKTGTGLAKLQKILHDTVYQDGSRGWEDALVTRARHREALEKALEHVRLATQGLGLGVPADLLTVDLSESWTALGEITGDTVADDLLDRIFAEFCIGK